MKFKFCEMKIVFIRPFINTNSRTSSEMNELVLPQAGTRGPSAGGGAMGTQLPKPPHLLEPGTSEGGPGAGFLTCRLPSGNKDNNLLY